MMFSEWIAKRKMTRAEAAKLLGVSATAITFWVHGTHRPSAKMTAKIYEVSGGDGVSLAKVTKQRDLEIEGEFGFGLDVVPLGINTRGKDVTSCVVVTSDVAKRKKRKRPRGAMQKTLVKALQNALVDHGKAVNDSRGVIVDEDRWQEAAFVLMSGEPKHKWTNFRRAADSLIGDDFVGYKDHNAWVLE